MPLRSMPHAQLTTKSREGPIVQTYGRYPALFRSNINLKSFQSIVETIDLNTVVVLGC